MIVDRFLSARRKRHQAEVEAQKLKTLKATMRTVQDIINKFLNNLMLFEMEAAAVMPNGSFEPLQELIEQTSQNLTALGDMESVREIPLAGGIGIDYSATNPPAQTANQGQSKRA